MKRWRLRQSALGVAFFLLVGALVLSLAWAVTLGSAQLTLAQVYGVIGYHLFGWGDPQLFGQGPVSDIVWYIRLPRLVLAMGVGAALSIAGVVMQAVARNPLADPYILGVSSGASLGATLAILTGFGFSFFGFAAPGVMAFIGAFVVSIVVIVLSGLGGRSTPIKLLLAGAAMSTLCGAFSSLFIYFSGEGNAASKVIFWTMGSLAGAMWETNVIMLLLAVVGTLFFYSQSRVFDVMILGDETAISLGFSPETMRTVVLLICSLMVGFAVFTSGLIGFVGLVVPHGVRMVIGSSHRKLIPFVALVGALFLLWADVCCRIILPRTELPIGLLTALIGAPWFLWLMVRKTYGFGGGER